MLYLAIRRFYIDERFNIYRSATLRDIYFFYNKGGSLRSPLGVGLTGRFLWGYAPIPRLRSKSGHPWERWPLAPII